MSERIDGGPAFPVPIISADQGCFDEAPNKGMSLRDWFAGMALSGLIAASPSSSAAEFAIYAYRTADAMLEERNG